MAKITGNPRITVPSEQEITQKGAKESLHNLKQKVRELQQSLLNDNIPQDSLFLDKVAKK
jgi:hypothetical protein